MGEGFDDVWAGDGGSGDAGQQEPGVVVDEVEDLGGRSVGEAPVGDVGLPALVGQVGFEAFPAGAGPLLGLWGDEAAAFQDAPDGGDSRRLAPTSSSDPLITYATRVIAP